MPETRTAEQIVGDRIRTLREAAGITQETFAKQVYVSQPAVSQWERGKKMPARPTQFRVADVLRTDRSFLFAEVVGRAA